MPERNQGKDKTMHCHQLQQLLVDYIDGGLPPEIAKEFEKHLEDCKPCLSFIKTYEAAIKITKKIEPSQMPQELKDKLKSFVLEKLKK
jgi:anti-sigma factor RsiW